MVWRIERDVKTRFSPNIMRDMCPVYLFVILKVTIIIGYFFFIEAQSAEQTHTAIEQSLNKLNMISFLTYLFVQTVANRHEPCQCDSFTVISVCDIIIDWYYVYTNRIPKHNALHQWCMPIVMHNHWRNTEMHNKLLTEKMSV